ncbi:hypothetical protein A1O7_01129 [Cladophialophora yegresii CBS 114405]|uniref:Uncharacterized protein n=1 Tax=Cladophialophora yegresii CBS 114405 TaxID=1182544 RepID=W9WJJ9_9EURO|nr:uncharacterized protein A1O7_01129 [Cladophialophora yegresii CBS 114405]EXJ64791.1 hypothetical protein A1O7_01129 [Cladophialophora yegresii CBS 114405]
MWKQQQVALAFLDSFRNLDYEANISLRTPDCQHYFAPASLGIERKNNEQFRSHVKSLQNVIEGIHVTTKDIYEGNHQITVWATGKTKFKETAKASDPGLDWTYEGEYVFIFTFDRAGERIQQILEFLDSKKVEEVRRLIRVAEGALAGRVTSPS